MKRDPRVDPIFGDEISRSITQATRAINGTIFRKVIWFEPVLELHCLIYVQSNGHERVWKHTTITRWRKWAKKAEIVTYGTV